MCLYIDNNTLIRKLAKVKKTKKYIFAYKSLEQWPNESYKSPYKKSFFWSEGLNTSNRKSVKLTKKEMESRDVYDGFHCYLRLKDLLINESGMSYTFYFRVKIKTKDLVAYGEFCNYPSLVCTKLTIDLNKPRKIKGRIKCA